MTEQKANGQQPADSAQPQVRVIAQYIKDLSFENPNIERMLLEPGENPNLQLEINVNARRTDSGLFESAIELQANATSANGPIYILEVVYGAMFKIENLPPQALEPLLLVNCPSLIFPYLRRLVADVTREGGFPPLNLDPIDFAALYMQRRQQSEENSAPPAGGAMLS